MSNLSAIIVGLLILATLALVVLMGKMFRKAGFTLNELRRSPGPQSFIISKK